MDGENGIHRGMDVAGAEALAGPCVLETRWGHRGTLDAKGLERRRESTDVSEQLRDVHKSVFH